MMNQANPGREGSIEQANSVAPPPASKFTAEVRVRLHAAAKSGATLQLCAECAGITYDTLRTWLADEDAEKAAFATEFRAHRANAHMGMHGEVVRAGIDGEWRALQWVLERTRPEYQPPAQHTSAVTGSENGNTLTPKQIDHRVVRMIAHPDKRMLELLRRAMAEANPKVKATIRECVAEWQSAELRASSIDTDGAEPGEPDALAAVPPDVDADLDLRLSRWFEVLRKFDRIALTGGPEAGKTTVFAAAVTTHRVIHTDDWLQGGPYYAPGIGWDDVPGLVASECISAGRYVCEGVRAAAIQRHGAEPQVVVWLSKPLPPMASLTPEQQLMWRGRETALGKLRAEYPQLQVVVI